MYYAVKSQYFPNNEFRITLYQHKSVNSLSEENPKSSCSALTCQLQKTLNGSPGNGNSPPSEVRHSTGYGTLGRDRKFSVYMRRQLLRAGGALRKLTRKEETLFLTLTIPGSGAEVYRAIASFSGYLVQRFKAWLAKRVKENLSLYTWEFQRRGALHLHYVVNVPNSSARQYICTNLKKEWARLIDAVSERSGVDCWSKSDGFSWKSDKSVLRVDAQIVQKDVCRYLSKYVSKQVRNEANQSRKWFSPSRWAGVSRPLLCKLESLTTTFVVEYKSLSEAREIFEDCVKTVDFDDCTMFRWHHEVGFGESVAAFLNDHETYTQETLWILRLQRLMRIWTHISFTNFELQKQSPVMVQLSMMV